MGERRTEVEGEQVPWQWFPWWPEMGDSYWGEEVAADAKR